jgi:hypothetical protein
VVRRLTIAAIASAMSIAGVVLARVTPQDFGLKNRTSITHPQVAQQRTPAFEFGPLAWSSPAKARGAISGSKEGPKSLVATCMPARRFMLDVFGCVEFTGSQMKEERMKDPKHRFGFEPSLADPSV